MPSALLVQAPDATKIPPPPPPPGPGGWRHAGPDWLRRRPGYGMIGTERTDSVGPTTKQAGTHDTARPGRKEDS